MLIARGSVHLTEQTIRLFGTPTMFCLPWKQLSPGLAKFKVALIKVTASRGGCLCLYFLQFVAGNVVGARPNSERERSFSANIFQFGAFVLFLFKYSYSLNINRLWWNMVFTGEHSLFPWPKNARGIDVLLQWVEYQWIERILCEPCVNPCAGKGSPYLLECQRVWRVRTLFWKNFL